MKNIRNFIVAVIFLAALSSFAFAQGSLHFDNPPTTALVNVGSALYSISLDADLAGSTKRTDSLGTVTINLKLNGAGRLELRIPERNVVYRGQYDEILSATSKKSPNGKLVWTATNVAIIVDWDNISQYNALSFLEKEIEWRATNIGKFVVVVEKNDRRVYLTTAGANAMKKVGATLNKDEFSLPSGAYSFKLASYKGALIFDSSGDNLTMRTMDAGLDETFAIKKSGEVVPVSPKKEGTRPRIFTPSERARIVKTT